MFNTRKMASMLGLAVMVFWGAAAVAQSAAPKNVILFIGDGMGPGQVQTAAFAKYGQEIPGENGRGKLVFEEFPVFGYSTTFSTDSLVTDSAASGTAMSCGEKTKNGMLCLRPDGSQITNLSEIAQQTGRSVGVITSVPIDHATPAAFYAKVPKRDMYDQITRQFFEFQSVDVLLGGSLKAKINRTEIQEMCSKANFAYFDMENLDAFRQFDASGKKIFGYFDSNADGFLNSAQEPTLADLSAKALDSVSADPDGFFMMIEGGAIDWTSHSNDTDGTIREMIKFDEAISTVIEKLKEKNLLDDTLLVVTADHETGGLVIAGPNGSALDETHPLNIKWLSSSHTASVEFVYAKGPGSDLFAGKGDNTLIGKRIATLLQTK